MGAEPVSARAIRGGRVRRVLVVVNRKAGTVQRQPQLPEILRRCVGERGEVVAPDDRENLLRAVGRARLQGVDTIAFCGGDGTNLAVATAVTRVYQDATWPRLILLAGGTLNTVAHNMGCAVPAPRLLADVLASEEPEVLRRPMLRINEHTGFIFGSQMVARVLDVYYEQYASPAGAVALTARIVLSAALGTPFSRNLFRPEVATVEAEGQQRLSGRYTCLMASTVPSPTAGIRAMPRAGEGGGFHLIGTEESPSRLFREAGRIYSGLPIAALTTSLVARRATITYETPCRFTVDGDLFTADRISLLTTPAVEFLRPATP